MYDADARKPLLRGLLLVLVFERPSHGYELAERLGDLGFEGMEGPVYRMLRRLSDDGSIEPRWDGPRYGPARRTYRITAVGEEKLTVWIASLAAVGYWSRSAGNASTPPKGLVARVAARAGPEPLS